MRFLHATFTRLGAPFHHRQRRLALAAVLLVVSIGLFASGLAGLLLAEDSEPALTNVANNPSRNAPVAPTATPIPTPRPSNAAIARLIIEKIGVDAPVITLGLDENGIPQVPDNPYDVAWYNWSTPPGHGGNAVFSGHYDWTVNASPVLGVFYSLEDLSPADIVQVKLEDGTDYIYSVKENLAIPDGDPRLLQFMAATPADTATLITCGNLWPPATPSPDGRYWSRQVVRAELIRETPAALMNEGQIEEPRQEDRAG